MIKTVYHYTKLENIKSILCNNEVCLYATHYKHYQNNDYNNTKKYLEPVIKEILGDKYDKDLTFEPYIISFTTCKGSHEMWGERFGDGGFGVRLGFDIEELKSCAYDHTNPDLFDLCSYEESYEKIKTILLKKYDHYEAKGDLVNYQEDLMTLSTLFIPQKFRLQKEYRYIIPKQTKEHLEINERGKIVCNKKIKENVEQKIECGFGKIIIKTIMLGPNTSEHNKIEIENYLKQNGFGHIRVSKSKFRL